MSAISFALTVSIAALLIGAAALYVAVTAARGLESKLQLPRSVASRLESLEQSAEETQSTLAQLANRVKMMRVRNAVNHVGESRGNGSGLPDPHRDPDGWRNAMNARIAKGKLGL